MRPDRPLSAILCLLLALAGCAGQAPAARRAVADLPAIPDPPFAWPATDAKAGDAVPVSVAVLVFAWPDDLQVKLTRAEKTTSLTGSAAKTSANSYSTVMTAAPVAEGYRISYSDMEVAMPNVTEHVRSALSASLQSLATVMFPPFIITRAGKFLRLEDPDQVLADTRSLIEAARQQKANAGDATVQVSTNLQEAVSAESISAQIGLIWNMMVGSWSGTTLTTGKGYGFRIPGSQSADKRVTTVTYSGVSRLVGRVACGPNEPPNGCVALETTIEADPGELKSWLHDRRPTVTAGAGTNGAFVFDIDSATRQTTMRLVAEPDTLLPRRLQWVNRGSTRLQLTPSKLAMDTHQQSEIVMDFQYLHR